MKTISIGVFLCCLMLNLSGAEDSAPQQTAAPEAETNVPWWEGKYALTGWNGAREALEKRGVFFDLRYAGDLRNNSAGGLSTNGATRYDGDVNAALDLFTDKFGLYAGGEFYVRFENVHGPGLSKHDVGDVQLISSIDAPAYSQISELFYRHSILDNRLHFKIGKQDGTGDFLTPKYGVDFTHSSFGCIPTVPIPRFFDDGVGAVVSFDATKWMTFATGVYDGNFGRHALGLEHPFVSAFHEFSIAELMFKPELLTERPTIMRIGAWHRRVDSPLIGALNPDGTPDLTTRFKHNGGGYFEFEQLLYRKKLKEKPQEEDVSSRLGPEPPEQGLALFSQFGLSPDDRNDQARYYGGGLYYKGLIKGRDDDSIGAGVASDAFSQRLSREHKTVETAIETFYKIKTTPFSSFQPDVQYILRPGGNGRNATTVGFRYQISF